MDIDDVMTPVPTVFDVFTVSLTEVGLSVEARLVFVVTEYGLVVSR